MNHPAKLQTAGADRAESAPGITELDARPVNRATDRALYAGRHKVYPQLAHGRFRKLKWLVMAGTLGVYYLLPWLRWPRGPNLPDQAVLLDIANNRFYFFFLEIWPQEFYFVTGLLVLAALTLFLVTSVAGRVWCGYCCPQTVWTDLMIMVERFWQGDRNTRMRLDKASWGPTKLLKKGMTHLSWLAIGVATGGAFIFYFRDAPTLARELLSGEAPTIALLFLAIFTTTTYLLGGLAREQVCTFMCPWPRIQGAMIDRDTLLVGYRAFRGEPRGPHKKGQSWEGRGDCIDCKACIAVCPAGIDIRDGSQLECIQCALCIDACNAIMARVGRPPGLIAYDTIASQEAAPHGRAAPLRLVRVRTMLYAAMICLVGAVMLIAVLTRTTLAVNVVQDRNPAYVLLSDGSVRNGYAVKILNKLHQPREFTLATRGLERAALAVVGLKPDAAIRVDADELRELRVLITIPAAGRPALADASVPFALIVRDIASGQETARATRFQKPAASIESRP